MKEYKLIDSFNDFTEEHWTELKKLVDKRSDDPKKLFERIKTGSQKILLLEVDKKIFGMVLYTGKKNAYIDLIWTQYDDNPTAEKDNDMPALFLLEELIVGGTKEFNSKKLFGNTKDFIERLVKENIFYVTREKGFYSIKVTQKGIDSAINHFSQMPFGWANH